MYGNSMIWLGLIQDDYLATEARWRMAREASIKSDRGWLSVAGRFWLVEGANSVGSDPTCGVRLPSFAPARYGTLFRSGDTVTLRVPGQSDEVLENDSSDDPDTVTVGQAAFLIIKRGARIGVRVYNPQSEYRLNSKGLIVSG
jgi:hypothetical protein